MVFGVAYGTDVKKAKASIATALAGMEHVLAEPAPFIEVETLNESSVDFLVRPFCKGEHWFDVRFTVPELVKKALDEAGIEIPFPHQKVILFKGDD